ncbi:MAG TPA: SpoIIE family protein phosphatase [Candidatus Hydrogenedentes bacterium]|nr:SpoIIE family protein phosphatase [Candidatus Hydrogenedentota bacterium]HOS01823.1 SpoIIE family protein phosphatase [Candidatus Hydrogenedentota bacterium]
MSLDNTPLILSIEDEATVRRSIVGYLEDSGFAVLEASNGQAGLDAFREKRPDLVLSDLRMPGVDGLRVLETIAREAPETPVIIVSGTGDMNDAVASLQLGAWDYVMKPIQDMAVLEHSIRKALERARLVRENRKYREHLEATNKRLAESLRQLQEDENAARRIQFQLLPPQDAVLGGFQFAHYLKTSAYLSGDFVDYFPIDAHNIGFYIADVSGHGASSAFVTVLLKSTMNHLIDQYRRAENDTVLHPNLVLKTINDDIIQRDFGKYLTMLYAVFDLDRHTMTFSNGGQFPPPVAFDGTRPQFLEDKNLPVGLFANASYNTKTFDVPDAFFMLLCSDGVLEILPHERLQEKKDFLLSLAGGPETTLRSIVDAMGLDTLESPGDDVTLMLVRKAPENG